MTFALRYLHRGDHFVDVGANIGAYSILAATWVAGVTVTAYEPDRLAASRLKENWALNGLPCLRLVRATVGAKRGRAYFTTGLDTVNHVTDDDEAGRITVPVVTLDDTADSPTLIKVDVEGRELEVLLGARKLLTTARPALLFELNPPLEALLDYLEGFGYALCRYDAATNRLLPTDRRALSSGETQNAIAVGDTTSAQKRLNASHLARALQPPIRVAAEIEGAECIRMAQQSIAVRWPMGRCQVITSINRLDGIFSRWPSGHVGIPLRIHWA